MSDIEIIETLGGNGKKKRKVLYKGRKLIIPHISTQRTTRRRYIRMKHKRIYLDDDITERELIKFIISQLAPVKPRKKKRAGPGFPKEPKESPVPMTISGHTTTFLPSGANDSRISHLKEEVENLKLLNRDQQRLLKESVQSVEERPQIKSPIHIEEVDEDGEPLLTFTRKRVEQEMKEKEDKQRSIKLQKNNTRVLEVTNMKVKDLREILKRYNISSSGLLKQQMINSILKHEFGGDRIELPDDSLYMIGEGKRGLERGMNTLEINKVMDKYPEFLGTIPSDGIPSLIPLVRPNTRVCWIMNSDPSGEEGSHWVAVLIDCRPEGSYSIEFYNPLGIRDRRRLTTGFLQDVIPLLEKINPDEKPLKLKENLIADQNNTSSNCGQFCIRFLIDRLDRNKTFSEATNYDSRGEAMIEKFKDDFYRFKLIQQNGRGLGDWIRKGYQYVKGKIVKGLDTVKGRVKDVLDNGLRDDFPPSGRSVLAKHGDEVITELVIARLPIKSWLKKILDWASSGKFSENLKSLDYDEAFHLMMKIKTNKGTSLLTEKNEVVKLKEEGWTSGDSSKPDTQKISVRVKPGISISEFFKNAIDKYGKSRIFIYDSRGDNCQQYVSDLLSANGMMTGDVSKFVMQDAAGIYKDMGLLGSINKGITNIAAGADVVLNGRGGGTTTRGGTTTETFYMKEKPLFTE